SRRRHTRFSRDWSSDVCSSDLGLWPEWLDVIPAIWGIAAGALLWAIGLLIEPKPQQATSMPEPQMPLPLPFGEPAIREALQYARSEERRVGKEERAQRAAARST